MFNGDIFLNGDFNQQEDATENYGQRNYLSVRYKVRAGSTVQYTTPHSQTLTLANFRVAGGAGIGTSLHIGGTSSGQGLFVGKKNSGDTVKFTVLGASGNTDIARNLMLQVLLSSMAQLMLMQTLQLEMEQQISSLLIM